MTDTAPLSAKLAGRILRHFGLPADAPPTLDTLNALVSAYTRQLPWESASRIVRRSQHRAAHDCAHFGEDFWLSHFEHGGGGTCYESNYAFFGLLRRMGYAGYLTINDMGESIGCHSAIVIVVDGSKALVDVGFPLYVIVPIDAERETNAACPIMRYSLRPVGDDQYQLRRELGERVHAFLLQDKAVSDADYRDIAIHDYRHDGGQFLNEVVTHRVVDERLWRFHSDAQPLCLQRFVNGERHDHALGQDPAGELAAKFGMDADMVVEAMAILGAAC